MKKSILAALLITCGCIVNILTPVPVGAILFAFGLISVCEMQANLYTGKCGLLLQNSKQDNIALLKILIVNLIAGWISGQLASFINPEIAAAAIIKISTWNNLIIHLIQSFFCGCIMYIAVYIKNQNHSNLGIIYGIPLFILCGFQHSIANTIYCGMALTISPYLLIAILGNTIGSVFTWFLMQSKDL